MFSHIAIANRNGAVSAIYKKCLAMGASSRKEFTNGAIITLFTQDVRNIERIFDGVISNVITSPTVVIIALALIYEEMGVSMFVGFGVLLVALPLVAFLFSLLHTYFLKKMKASEERIKFTTEIFSGIRIVKVAKLVMSGTSSNSIFSLLS